MRVGEEQKKAARKADLYGYLLQYHSDTVQKSGHNRLQNKEHDSLIITKGKGYCHNSINETGNGIDYLMKYLGYSFTRAVAVLANFGGFEDSAGETISPAPSKAFNGNFKRVFAYLTKTRGIPAAVVDSLIKKKLLYEDERHNCVFNSADCNYSELVGTLSNIRFKGISPQSDSDGYWMYGAELPNTIYICESAIDAISLSVIQTRIRDTSDIAWISIGGLKPAAVNRLIHIYDDDRCVLAIDNDEAANKFAAAFPTLRRIKPKAKDWNEDIINGAGKKDS